MPNHLPIARLLPFAGAAALAAAPAVATVSFVQTAAYSQTGGGIGRESVNTGTPQIFTSYPGGGYAVSRSDFRDDRFFSQVRASSAAGVRLDGLASASFLVRTSVNVDALADQLPSRGFATAEAAYDFAIDTPSRLVFSITTVPVSASDDAFVSLGIYARDAQGVVGQIYRAGVVAGQFSGLSYALPPGIYSVEFGAYADGGIPTLPYPGGARASALVGASLSILSPPLPPTPSSVPEPTGWATMLLGFAAIGGNLRGRGRLVGRLPARRPACSFPGSARMIQIRLARLVPLLAALASASAHAAPSPPTFSAGIIVTPDYLLPNDTATRVGYPLFGDDPSPSSSPLSYRLTHLSALGTGTIGTAVASPDNGGTVRVSASTNDEQIGAEASVGYIFQLRPKANAVVPAAVPLHVLALGGTGSDGTAGARITFILNYYESPVAARSILRDTGVTSVPTQSTVFGGNGNINVDETITTLLNRDIFVSLYAAAGAGFGYCCSDPLKNQYGTGTAYLDPVFTLPEAYRDLVDIVGVPQGDPFPPTNPGVVPEPATWVLAVLGFGLIGAGLRRDRRPGRGMRIGQPSGATSSSRHSVRRARIPLG